MALSQEEIDACQEAFREVDVEKKGQIDVWELRLVLQELGQNPTDKEFFEVVSSVDREMKGVIDFNSFLKIVASQKNSRSVWNGDSGDLVDAFVACGGSPDETGSADVRKIVKIVKMDFGLDVDIEGIIESLDAEGTGQLGFTQFKEMLTAS
ncbi:unnamed protein product [Discosporangium mesarthrocarpum]